MLTGTVEATAAGGVANLSPTIEKAGAGYTLVGSAEGLESVESWPFEITPAKAEALKFVEVPALVEGREPFRVRVGLYDRFGNLTTTSADSVRLELGASPRGDTLGGTLVRRAIDGLADFDDLILMLPGGGYRLDAFQQGGDGSAQSGALAVGLSFTSVTVGANSHVCGVTTAQHIYCWGENTYGQVGDGSTTFRQYPVPISVPLSTRFTQVDAGLGHSCAVAVGGAAYCWGYGGYGVLGDGEGAMQLTPTRVEGTIEFRSISAGAVHTCGVAMDGKAYCWGTDGEGRLGRNVVGGAESQPVPVAGNHTFTAVSAGGFHTCGVTTAGEGYCWGSNHFGLLGNQDKGPHSGVPVRLPFQGLGAVYTSISAGEMHVCALVRRPRAGSDAMYCWGFNEYGQLGDSTTTDRSSPTLVSSDFGGSSPSPVLSAGFESTCASTMAGKAYCWGNNPKGMLGTGDLNAISTPAPVGGMVTFPVVATNGQLGRGTSCGVAPDGSVYCWGYNARTFAGQTGDSILPVRVAH